MPLCDATRDVAEVAAGIAEAVRVMIEVTMLAMIVPGRFVAFRCLSMGQEVLRVSACGLGDVGVIRRVDHTRGWHMGSREDLMLQVV